MGSAMLCLRAARARGMNHGSYVYFNIIASRVSLYFPNTNFNI